LVFASLLPVLVLLLLLLLLAIRPVLSAAMSEFVGQS
jgi:hypothetical protein